MTLLGQRPPRCRWCGRGFDKTPGVGRPRQYCKRSCRQRDYEARRRANELGLGEDELIVTREELNELRDRLYVLGETVKDVERDLTDDEADDERRLLNVLLHAANQAVSQPVSAPAVGSDGVPTGLPASAQDPTAAAPPNRR